jgi:hypothetical protein
MPTAAQLCDVVPPKIYDRYDLDRYFAIKVRTENEEAHLKTECGYMLRDIAHVEELALDYKYRVLKCKEKLESTALPIIQCEEEKLTDMLGLLSTHLTELNKYVVKELLPVSSSIEVMRLKLNGYEEGRQSAGNDWGIPASQEAREIQAELMQNEWKRPRNYAADGIFTRKEVDQARHVYLDKVVKLERKLKEIIKRLLEYKEHKAETEAVRKFIDEAIEKAFQELKKGNVPAQVPVQPMPVPAPALPLISMSGEEMLEAYNRSIMMEAHVYTEDEF